MLKKLNARHREIARLYVAGLTPQQVAAKTGMTLTGLKLITESALFQQLYGELSCEADSEVVKARQELTALIPKGLEVVRKVLENPVADKVLQVKTAWDIFDRVGLAPVKELKVESTNIEAVSDSELLDKVTEIDEQLKQITQAISGTEENSLSETAERPSSQLDSTQQAESLH